MRRAAPRLTGLLDTVRTEGIGWVWRRLRYHTPATAAGRALHGGLRRALGGVLAPARRLGGADVGFVNPTILYAFYDLQVSQITYDAAWFAIAADRARRGLGLDRMHFVVVPGTRDGLREERAAYEGAVDHDARLWRLHNIVIPIFGLVPAAAGYTLLPDRQAAGALRARAGRHIYPHSYEPALPIGHHPSELLQAARAGDTDMAVLQSPVQARRFVDRWLAPRLAGRRLVTITLRDYAFMPARNSDTRAWATFARGLPRDRYLPVFVLDTQRTLDPVPELGDLEIAPDASWSVPLRLALYERAFLNLGVNNGPLLMGALGARTRLLVFKMITPSVPQTTEEFMRRLGFEIGGQLPFATPLQRLVWEDDRLPVIEREFDAMVARIEAAEGAAAATAGRCDPRPSWRESRRGT
jgi:hypothetical protein